MSGRIIRRLAILAWLAVLACPLVGCRPSLDAQPSPPSPERSSARIAGTDPLVAGGRADVRITVDLPAGLERGAILVSFQHPWFGAGGGTPQFDDEAAPAWLSVQTPGAQLGRAPRGVDPGPVRVGFPGGLPAGAAVELSLRDVPVQRFTESAWRPLLLLETAGPAYVEIPVLDPAPVRAGPPAALRLVASHDGGLRVGIEDRFRNAIPDLTARVDAGEAGGAGEPARSPQTHTITTGPDGQLAPWPERLDLEGARRRMADRPDADWAATRWVGEARLPDGQTLRATSNPVPVGNGWPTTWYGDLHGHTAFSDGAGTPQEALRHARDVAGVDFAALTEHGWQLEPQEWQHLREAAQEARRPGRFGALLAFEYDLGGDRCVYFRDDDADLPIAPGGPRRQWQISLERRAPVAPPAPPRFSVDPGRLEAWLPEGALAIPHTSASPWMGDHLERMPATGVLEVASAHGQSDSPLVPRPVAGFDAGGGLPALLAQQQPVGLVAAGDDHGGHLGRTVWGPHQGGLAAVQAETPDGPAIWDALRAHRSHAVAGRPLLDVRLEPDGDGARLHLHAIPDQRFEKAEVLVDGRVLHEISLDEADPSRSPHAIHLTLPADPSAGAIYARLQEAHGTTWTSPLRLGRPGQAAPATRAREAELPPAAANAPFPLALGVGATLHPMRRPDVTLGRVEAGEATWSPPPPALPELFYVGPEGRRWQVLVARPDEGPDRYFLREIASEAR